MSNDRGFSGHKLDTPPLGSRPGNGYSTSQAQIRHAEQPYFVDRLELPRSDIPRYYGEGRDQSRPQEPYLSKKEQSVDAVLETFSERTSLAGVPYIRNATYRVSRFIWLLIFLAAVGASCWQLQQLFDKYFGYPIKTDISLGFSTLDFPTVTICNVNPLRASMTHLDPEMDKFLQQISDNFGNIESDLERYDWWDGGRAVNATAPQRKKRTSTDPQYDYYDWYSYQDGNDEDIGGGARTTDEKQNSAFYQILGTISDDIRYQMGHQKELSILSCSYHGLECSAANFSTILSADLGNCFRFNGPDTRTQPLLSRMPGIRNGLQLILYVEQREHLSGFTESSGFQLDVTPFHTMSFPEETGISLKPGSEINVGMKYVSISRLGDPHWTCNTSVEFNNRFGYNYSVEACLRTCSEVMIAKSCSCMRPEYAHMYPISQRNLSSCANSTTTGACVSNILQQVSSGTLSCVCEQACKEYTYTTGYSALTWPDNGMWFKMVQLLCTADNREDNDQVNAGESCDTFKEVTDEPMTRAMMLNTDFVKVNLYFTSLNFETIVESQEYAISDFGSDIGGTIGLWVGFSIFTAVELLDLLLQIMFFYCVTKKNQPSKRRPKDTGRERHVEDYRMRRH